MLEKEYGHFDILVNCVGIQIEQPITEVTEEAFDQVYMSNLKAAMFLAQAVAKRQIRRRSGRQIHLLSVRAQLGLRDRGYSACCFFASPGAGFVTGQIMYVDGGITASR